MTHIWASLRQHAWLYLLVLVLFLFAALVADDWISLAALLVFMFVVGAVTAVAFPEHPLRNGTLAGIVAYVVGTPVDNLVRYGLGISHRPEGETWLELLVGLLVSMVVFSPVILLALLGAGLVVIARRGGAGSSAGA